MIHVAFDTSGIGQNRSINNINYKALKRLVSENLITIHIPHVVKREIETQQAAFYLEHFQKIIKNFKDFRQIPKNKELNEFFLQIENSLNIITENVHSDAKRFSEQWIKEINGEIYGIDSNEAVLALEAYFQGSAPLTSVKNRLDIPDSFICRSFEKIQTVINDLLIIVVSDKKIKNTFKNNDNFNMYDDIHQFVNSDLIQPLLKNLDYLQSISTDLIKFIRQFEQSDQSITSLLKHTIGESIVYKSVYGVPNSNEHNGEATITSYYDGNNININFDDPTHYGDDLIGFPFDLEIEVSIEYFISKSEYWAVAADDNFDDSHLSIGDWNDHTYEVEEIVLIKVQGIVSIKIKKSEFLNDEIKSMSRLEIDDYLKDIYQQSDVKIESIENIELV
ncbi:PIN domain-containing protein [Acinetobacter sp. AS167]|uniref:PIN domain-containing protein n=1 Tax=Acinetobacter sp. AS167 TaxID=3127884 RepID=UPI003019C0BB